MSEDKRINEQADAQQHEEVKSDILQEQETKPLEAEEKKELTAEEKYAELNDRFIRLYAEFDNFRKRTTKERLDLISSASATVMKDLLAVLDDFERAIQTNEEASDIQAMKEGFQLIYQKFKGILESKGLKPMLSKGEVFDSELHEAIANIPAPTEDEKGKVVDDVEKGYYLNDKVIRFAKVVVGQ
jgi:molecular chaperone GrpE